MEILTSKKEQYRSLAFKAAKHCGMNVKNTQRLILFKINGTKIVESDKWTLGGYAKSIKKSPSSVKLGVGCAKGGTQTKVCIHIV